ncbi:flagellar hook-length control protein FliK [uncultured Nevskia sp.]|uniref:flagellar hook-length control protein FliK n=1 Tax=uncultured Nevskia sp. TaxID=228950 RepID=UPI0025CF8852|nr:flagellar hook-length control protein FliK [uncultured Nevskia sp.]
MSAGLSAMLPTSAVGGSRATVRSEAANEPKDKGSPFADLLGAGPAASKAAASKEAKAAEDDKNDKDSDEDRDDGSEASNAAPADAVPALPAWLQALRVPPPVAVPSDGQPGAADDSDALLAGAVGSIRTPTATLTADAPALPTSSAEPAAFTASLGAALDAVTPSADTALTAAQNASLDSALDAQLIKADLPTVPVTAVTAERAPPAINVTPASSDSATSLLATAPSAALDAYGEPLSLDGPDAAVRLGERLRWLSEAGVQEARLQLHPRELGSIDVRIRVEQQTASVWFGADHPAARAALEASLPQLRERMAADGLQLGQAQIGGSAQFQSQEREAGGQGRPGAPSRSAVSGSLVDEPIPGNDLLAAAVARHRGLIDRYV